MLPTDRRDDECPQALLNRAMAGYIYECMVLRFVTDRNRLSTCLSGVIRIFALV